MEIDHITELTNLLENDQASSHPKYPVQALLALNDERVARMVVEYLQNNNTLLNISSLGYSFYTGLIPISFEFMRLGGIGLRPAAFLVLLNHKCEVVGIVNPFDPVQPNPKLPSLPKTGEQPFALSRPSNAEHTIVSSEQLYPREVRNKEFFQRLSIPIKALNISPGDPPDTVCTYTTFSRTGSWTTSEPTGFPVTVDSVHLDYETDETLDSTIDDSGTGNPPETE
jgi:hypothetical protein